MLKFFRTLASCRHCLAFNTEGESWPITGLVVDVSYEVEGIGRVDTCVDRSLVTGLLWNCYIRQLSDSGEFYERVIKSDVKFGLVHISPYFIYDLSISIALIPLKLVAYTVLTKNAGPNLRKVNLHNTRRNCYMN
jgi:hypothetical protein